MKPGIHPEYYQTSVTCACGNAWTTGGTTPEIRVDVCNKCHPFFTGQQRIVDTLGRVWNACDVGTRRPRSSRTATVLRPFLPSSSQQFLDYAPAAVIRRPWSFLAKA